MRLENIKILNAIAKFGSINAAAENLFMAKSAISTSIKQAELEFGFDLLDRSGYRVQLSHKAKMYLEKAQKLLQLADDLDAYTKQLGDNIESSIKISSSLLFDLQDFISLIKKANKKFPSTSVVIEREVLSGEKMLLDEIVDLAITEVRTDTVNIESKQIATVSMPLVISASHDFVRSLKHKKDIEYLQDFPQIVLRSTFADSSATGGIYKNAPHWNVSDDFTKLELIRQGLGWGRMPEYLIKKDLEKGKLIRLDNIEKALSLAIYISRRSRDPHGKVAEFIWEFF